MTRKDELSFEERKTLKSAIQDSPFHNPNEKMPYMNRALYDKLVTSKDQSNGDRAVYRAKLVKTAMAERFGGIKSPDCAICNKMVETFSMDYSPQKDQVEFTVTCHGGTQLFFRSFEEIKKSNQLKIVIPKAFKPGQGELHEGIVMTKLKWGWESKEEEIKRKEQDLLEDRDHDIEKMDYHDFDAIEKSVD